MRCAFAGVLLPLVTAGVGNAFAATVGIHIRRCVHAELVRTASARRSHMERGLLAEPRVVPLDGERDVAALRGGAVLVVRGRVRRFDFKWDHAGAAVVLVVGGHNGGRLTDGYVVLVGDSVLVARHGRRRDGGHHGIARVANVGVLDTEHAGVDRLRCVGRYIGAGGGADLIVCPGLARRGFGWALAWFAGALRGGFWRTGDFGKRG